MVSNKLNYIVRFIIFYYIINITYSCTNEKLKHNEYYNDLYQKDKNVEINIDSTLKTRNECEVLNTFIGSVKEKGFYIDTVYLKKVAAYSELTNQKPIIICGEFGYHSAMNKWSLYKYPELIRPKKMDIKPYLDKIDTTKAFYFRKGGESYSSVIDFVIAELVVNDSIWNNNIYLKLKEISYSEEEKLYYTKIPFYCFMYKKRIFIIYSRGTYGLNDIRNVVDIFEEIIK